ncbi:Spermine synthase, putative [Pediculus humanus corporis]|uniref:Spermine synthase, putative n=1 Tax=Pediculus humanus subsp. corporis TaxID=121224 RepID=E0W345_PEDHC|nr:Spermine synthase, putative [Pediculus humanus corporis]EEB20051.1 Spermine synthase, putative [Pediculus humanus corporis]
MAVNTFLLDFTVNPNACETVEDRYMIKENVESCLKEYIKDIKCDSFRELDGGFLSIFFGAKGTFITVRGLKEGIVTINIEYYKSETEDDMLTFEQLRLLELSIGKALASARSKHLPPIKRGGAIDVYLTTSDERILEYDIDKVVFEETSPYQKIQIVHSKSLGNILLLDDLQNMSESDLIYTETLMQRGVENYENKEIIILGGGDGCLLWELLKENPKFITMLELDEVVIKACGVYLRSSCGNCLDNYKGDKYEIIVGDCFETLEKFIKEGKKVDYVFGDLTDVPVDTSGQNGEMWNFIRLILNKSMQVIRPGGKFLTHGNGASAVRSLQLYEKMLQNLKVPVKFTTAHAFIPSFLEDWVFYQITPCFGNNLST